MNEEVLIPEKDPVTIGDKVYYIGELSLKQFMQITKFITRTILSSQKKLKELKEKTDSNTSNVEDIISILDLLDDKDVYIFMGILLNENNISFIENKLTLAKSTEIIAIICEHNNIDFVKKNIQRILKATKLTKTQ